MSESAPAPDALILGSKRYSSWSLRGWLAVRLAGLEVAERVIPLAGGQTPAVSVASPSGLVPVLHHRGAVVWDSLAIGEYCAELVPALWPRNREARAMARSMAAEMHSGFRALRLALPMNTWRARALPDGLSEEVRGDVARIEAVWGEARARFGADGPFLFGAEFTLADAAFAPVVLRFLGYAVALGPVAAAYRDAVRAHPLLEEWCRDAAAEPAEWQLPRYELPS